MNANQSKQNHSRAMLLHGEGAAIAASLITDAKYRTEMLPYKEWRGEFASDFDEPRADDSSTIINYQEQFRSISEQYDGVEDAIAESTEYQVLTDQMRGTGVSSRWDYERFFINNSSEETHGDILGAYQSDGSYRYWTSDELKTIGSGGRALAQSGENLGQRVTYEGHHGMDVSSLDYEDIENIHNPDGIRLFTPRGHLEVGHDGSWSNPSDAIYTDITDRTDSIIREERFYYSDQEKTDDLVGLTMGVAFGSIAAIAHYKQLLQNPAPWNRHRALLVTGAFLSGAATGFVPYLLIRQMHNPIRESIENNLAIYFNEGELLPQDSLLDSFADASGSFVLIMSAITVRTIMQGSFQFHRRGAKETLGQMSSVLKRSTVEQTGFFTLQMMLDSLTPMPDATLSLFITSTRVLYGFGKMGMHYNHSQKLDQENLNAFYDAAYGVLLK